MENKKKINGKIEFLRFPFALMVVFQHTWHFLGYDISPFEGGSFAVEFFFMVSGYLMMATVDRRNRQPAAEPIGKETARFVFHKAAAIFPEALVAWCIGLVVTAVSMDMALWTAIRHFLVTFWELIFVSMTGLGKIGVNTSVWYISAMLIWMLVLYPLLRKRQDIMVHIVMPLTMLFAYGFLFRKFSNPRDPAKWVGLCYKGMFRAYADLCVGVFLYFLAGYLRQLPFNRTGRRLLALIENGLYVIIFAYMAVQGACQYDYFFILLLGIAVALTFSDASADSRFFCNRVSLTLGRLSVPIYLSHLYYAYYMNKYIPESCSIALRLGGYLAVSFATAAVVMAGGKLLRKLYPRVRQWLCRVMLES